jgi:glycogen debranching enzyme
MKVHNPEEAHSFSEIAKKFMESTEQFVKEGVNPGGHYKAVWCRDASYILRDWFLSGRFEDVMQEILFIWSHQIAAAGERIIYGRGSPEMKYLSQIASAKIQKDFSGALPTTIFHGFSEVYGRDPDIDSTALMISATSWILDAYIKSGIISASTFSSSDATGTRVLKVSSVVSNPSTVIDYVVPRMLQAVDYLASRDVDGDGLLEQGHNEDWMDTILRAGKVVYSQACWLLALSNLSSLLTELKSTNETDRLVGMAKGTIRGVERHLWLEEEGTYLDKLESHHIGESYKTLTQDVSLYLTAVTENTLRDSLSVQSKVKPSHQLEQEKGEQELKLRANSTLDAIKNRMWKNSNIPLVTEAELSHTGPWVLDPNQYHNHTFWPWTTGMEMVARSRFDRVDECYSLLSMLTSKAGGENLAAFYEWVHPVSLEGKGAFPFRTGISAIRIALTDILAKSG